MTQEHFRAAAQAIQSADALVISAGAGMGVDSGLPDFRGNEGFWNEYPIAAKLGLTFAQLANPQWFKSDPALAWAFYGHRLNLYRATKPHAGFAKLLARAKKKSAGYFVFTSNVDGHFQRAGFSPEHIEECHGSIHHLQCLAECTDDIWDAQAVTLTVDENIFRALPPLPHCPRCGGMARPNILMFGDYHWIANRSDAQHARFARWLDEVRRKSARLAVIELGAGTAIPTVRMTSESLVHRHDAKLIRINPREPGVPPGNFGFATGALDGIQKIDKAMFC